jgi:DNA-binding Lrp family transcriptional regulator
VLNRRKRLEKHKIILGYTAILNPTLFARKENVMILLKFAPLLDNAEIMKFSSYLRGSSFCFFATRMIGGAEGYDYACNFVFDTEQQFHLQLEFILSTFGDLIANYQVYKLEIIKETPRVLPSFDDLEVVTTSNSLNKQATIELEEVQDLLSRCEEENARSIMATFGSNLEMRL